MKHLILIFLISVLFTLISCTNSMEYQDTFVSGRVLQSGNAVSGVMVDIISTTIQTAVTNSLGYFTVDPAHAEDKIYLLPSKAGYRFEPAALEYSGGGTISEFECYPTDAPVSETPVFNSVEGILEISGLKRGDVLTIMNDDGQVLFHKFDIDDETFRVDSMEKPSADFPKVFYYILGNDQNACVGRFAF